ncbi:hypothetical protein L1887_47148 [Cichorium endivia]|nr:hypothetical protein L1887_47148 [Cichorium endivia]
MQRCVWSQLSRLDDLIPTFLDVFAEAAMDSGLHTERFEAVLDTMVSFASINLRGKLLSRLRKVIAKTAQNAVVSQLHLNASWKEIATLVRMNMVLSFTNRVEALLYLPELLHVILLLAGNGTDATRHAIYGSAINLVHSLCTEDQREARKPEEATPRSAEAVAKLRALLERLAEPEALKLFGLPAASQATSTNAAFGASTEMVRDPPDNASIERLALLMYEVADAAALERGCGQQLARATDEPGDQHGVPVQSDHPVAGVLCCSAAWRRGRSTTTCCTRSWCRCGGSISEWASSSSDMPMISIVTCLSKGGAHPADALALSAADDLAGRGDGAVWTCAALQGRRRTDARDGRDDLAAGHPDERRVGSDRISVGCALRVPRAGVQAGRRDGGGL